MVRLSHTIALNALRCDFLHMMLTQEPYLIVRPGELFLLRARDEAVCSAQGLFRFVWENEWQGGKC
jgi:hypothetical protein